MENKLFNQAYLDKYSNKFELTDNKISIINEYLAKLEIDGFLRERSNYTYFYIKILNCLLGYEIDETVEEDASSDSGTGISEFILTTDNKRFMVVELKPQHTNLDNPQLSRNDRKTPVQQAFDYARDNDDVDWILVSNYDEFRLYNWEKKKNKYISFEFKDLQNEKYFQYFMLVFSLKSHHEGLIKILMETISVDWEFESNFYDLYHQTRLMLITELKRSGFTNINAIHYAQIILNRYIFICFAEDTNIIEMPETTKTTIINTLRSGILGRGNVWRAINDLFIDFNEGSPDGKIGAFNGGIFEENLSESGVVIRDYVDKEDFIEIPQEWDFKEYEDAINNDIYTNVSPVFRTHVINNLNPIFKNLLIMARFNFASQVNVNILGHIFENSINDLEKLYDGTYDTNIRRRGGIYYTPEYITDFICRNTIIPYLSISGDSITVEDLVEEYPDSNIDLLENKMDVIRILDPACGSGAFLNKAVDILIEIFEEIHKVRYKNDHSLDPHFDNTKKRREVLLKNIYGVDINRESVEITKLSLFLKIAQKRDPNLPTMDKNIKCGNSLLEDEEYTTKPFVWEDEDNFESIFEDGKFDIVIGNPPYVAWYEIDERKAYESGEFLDINYHCRPNHKDSQPNLYLFFLVRSLNLLKNNGFLSFIIPQEWLSNSPEFKDYFLEKSGNIYILKFDPNYRVFKNDEEEVGTNSLIIRFEKSNGDNFYLYELNELKDHVVEFFLKRFNLQDIFIKNTEKYNLSKKKFNKSRFEGLRWESYSDIIENLLLTLINGEFINFDNEEYFKVKGGFQPNVELSKKFIIKKEILDVLTNFEKTNVFPCIYDASEIKRYDLEENFLYWIVLNGLFNNEIEFREMCPNLSCLKN